MASHGKGICGGAVDNRKEEGGLWLAMAEGVGASMPRRCATVRRSYKHDELGEGALTTMNLVSELSLPVVERNKRKEEESPTSIRRRRRRFL